MNCFKRIEAHIHVPIKIVMIQVNAILARVLMLILCLSNRAAIKKELKIPEKLVKKDEKARDLTVKC